MSVLLSLTLDQKYMNPNKMPMFDGDIFPFMLF